MSPPNEFFDNLFGEVSTNRAILIKVKNPDALARSQGAMASLAQGLAPAMIEAKVYETMASELRTKLAAQKVDAEVTVVEPTGWGLANGASHVATDLGYAIGGAGVLALFWYLFSGHKK